jgi:divalent metal cation (Fe/Co/Zn/Cd) transporter
MWLLRNTPIGGYISPVVSVFVALYLMVGCIKRIKKSLDELTDKTLPEEQQLKILKVLTQHYNSYAQVHSIDSRKIGTVTRIDIHLSFENDTKVEEVTDLQKQMQDELISQFGNCNLNIIVRDK